MIQRLGILLLVILGALGGCTEDPKAQREQRVAQLRQTYQDGGEIHLGAVWAGTEDAGFLAGAKLAVEELNAEGGIVGHKLRLNIIGEAPFLEKSKVDRAYAEGRYRSAMQEAGTAIAHAVIADPLIGAVIGHSDHGQTTLSAMAAYEQHGVMLLSAGTTDDKVRWLGSELYFQLLPSNKRFAKKLADEMTDRHWNNVHLVYAASRHNEQLVELIKAALANQNIALSGSTALVGDALKSQIVPPRLRSSLAELRSGSVDAVVLLAPPDLGARVIRFVRSLGIAQPFIGTMSLDSANFVRDVGQAGADTIIADIYRDNSYQQRRFAAKFRGRFPAQEADKWAALGYDSVNLYAQAVACAGTTDPFVVAQTLYFKLPLWLGVVGRYGFRVGEGHNEEMRFAAKVLRRQTDGSFKFIFTERADEDETLAQ